MSNTPSAAVATAQLTSLVELLKGIDLQSSLPAELVPLVKAVQSIGAFSTAVDAEIQRRAIGNSEMLPGVVVKDGVTHRKWHDQDAAEQLAQETFGDRAFERKLLPPAGIEKLGAEGKTFVAVASFKPEGVKRAVY